MSNQDPPHRTNRDDMDPDERTLPMYLPLAFRSWCEFYAHILAIQRRFGWDKLPKKMVFTWEEIEDMGDAAGNATDRALYKQGFNIQKVKALAFEELWAALPTKPQTSRIIQAMAMVYSGGPGYEDTRKALDPLFPLLPKVKT